MGIRPLHGGPEYLAFPGLIRIVSAVEIFATGSLDPYAKRPRLVTGPQPGIQRLVSVTVTVTAAATLDVVVVWLCFRGFAALFPTQAAAEADTMAVMALTYTPRDACYSCPYHLGSGWLHERWGDREACR